MQVWALPFLTFTGAGSLVTPMSHDVTPVMDQVSFNSDPREYTLNAGAQEVVSRDPNFLLPTESSAKFSGDQHDFFAEALSERSDDLWPEMPSARPGREVFFASTLVFPPVLNKKNERDQLKKEWATILLPELLAKDESIAINEETVFFHKCLINRARYFYLVLDDEVEMAAVLNDLQHIARVKQDEKLAVKLLTLQIVFLLSADVQQIEAAMGLVLQILQRSQNLPQDEPFPRRPTHADELKLFQLTQILPASIWTKMIVPTLTEYMPVNPRRLTDFQADILRAFHPDDLSGDKLAPWIRAIQQEDHERRLTDVERNTQRSFSEHWRNAYDKVHGTSSGPYASFFWRELDRRVERDASLAPQMHYLRAYRAFVEGDYFKALATFARTRIQDENQPGMAMDDTRTLVAAKASLLGFYGQMAQNPEHDWWRELVADHDLWLRDVSLDEALLAEDQSVPTPLTRQMQPVQFMLDLLDPKKSKLP